MSKVFAVRRRYDGAALACMSIVLLSSPAFAQTVPIPDAAEPSLQEEPDATARVTSATNDGDIVVTARRRSETLTRVPVAVSALTSEGINRYSATDLTRIADNIPSVQISRASTGSGGLISIRGIYSPFNNPGIESSVSVAIDNVQISRGYVTQAAFFDLQQVEVLKGPQALYFGKNSPAGVISLTSRGPTNRWEGYATVGYEFRADERYIEAAAGGPLTPELGMRVAVRASDMEGWLRNTASPRANPLYPALPLPGATNNKRTPDARSIALRGTIEYRPTNDLSAVVKVLYAKYQDNDLTGQNQVVRCGGRPNPTTLGQVDLSADCTPDNRRSFGVPPIEIASTFPYAKNGKFFSDNRSLLASLGLTYDLGNLTLNSTTGLYDLKAVGFSSYDGTVFAYYPGVNGEYNTIVTQEARLTSEFDGRFDFMAGLYYEHGARETFTVASGGFGQPVPIDPSFRGGSYVGYWPNNRVWTNAYSAFGQIQFDVTDELQLAGGLRYTKERKRAHLQNLYVNPGLPLRSLQLPVDRQLRGGFSDDNISPEATLTWHPSPQQTLYIAYKTGYKSGGFATGGALLAADTIQSLTFGSETAKGFELGYKAQLFSRRLTLSSALYNYQFDDLQRASRDDVTGAFIIRNAASARTKGAELELSFEPTEGVNLRSALNYNDAYFLAFRNSQCFSGQTVALGCVNGSQDISGQTIALAPKFSGSFGATLDKPIGDRLALALAADVRYVSRYRTQDDNTPGAYQNGYAKFNASIGIRDVDRAWSVSLIGVNLLNKYAILYTTTKPGGAPGDLYGTVERGREIRLQANHRF